MIRFGRYRFPYYEKRFKKHRFVIDEETPYPEELIEEELENDEITAVEAAFWSGYNSV